MNALPSTHDLDRAFPIGSLLQSYLADAAAGLGTSHARRSGLRTWAVEEQVGPYVRRLAKVRLTDGGFRCEGVNPPDKDAANAILTETAEFSACWPKPVPARSTEALVSMLRAERGREPLLFECRSPAGDEILHVQERLDLPDGRKVYVPWTQFSDGEWYRAEPDDGLPLFGLEKLGLDGPIMIHEGAKAADAVTRMLADGGDHPWLEELTRYQHLGWIGGALRPGDTDWLPIKRLSADREVVLVADNDVPGVQAVRAISQLLGRRLTVVLFDDSFPAKFDLADDWPSQPEWWEGKRYRGPRLDSLRVPATWATRPLPKSGDRGRHAHAIREEFAREWVWALDPPVFIHREQPDRLLSAEVFNRRVRPFSDVEDTARLLGVRAEAQVDGIAYRP